MTTGKRRRVAVVTGSSKGIGKAIAQEFASAGYSITLNARDEEELKRAAADISKSIGSPNEKRITFVAGDISQEQVCTKLIQHAVDAFGRIDVLVNNAGIGGSQKTIDQLTSDDWDYVFYNQYLFCARVNPSAASCSLCGFKRRHGNVDKNSSNGACRQRD